MEKEGRGVMEGEMEARKRMAEECR